MHYAKITALDAVEAGILSADEIEDARRHLPEGVFRELYLAEPSDDGGNPFGLAAISQCIGGLSLDDPVAWGWDLAKSGDWTVGIALDRRGRVCRFERFQRPWAETLSAIRAATGRVLAFVDSTGVGDPILEQLQRSGGRYEGFHFSSVSKQQLLEGLALAIQQGDLTFPAGPIVAELEGYEYEYTRTGVRYSSPAGMHDDCVIALALAVHGARSWDARRIHFVVPSGDGYSEEIPERYIDIDTGRAPHPELFRARRGRQRGRHA